MRGCSRRWRASDRGALEGTELCVGGSAVALLLIAHLHPSLSVALRAVRSSSICCSVAVGQGGADGEPQNQYANCEARSADNGLGRSLAGSASAIFPPTLLRRPPSRSAGGWPISLRSPRAMRVVVVFVV